jgi:thioredoxin reductase (NADPH)
LGQVAADLRTAQHAPFSCVRGIRTECENEGQIMSDVNAIERVVIIGSGPAGLTAAIYAARAGLNPVVLCGANAGGQLMLTSQVENYPGFPKGILGPQLMEDMQAQAEHCGARLLSESAEALDVKSMPFVIRYAGKRLQSHTLIFATGAAPRGLGLTEVARYSPPRGSGIHTCAVCDGTFFRRRAVAVVGGGDGAMEEAIYLAKLCSSVTVIHRSDEFRASKVMLDRAKANPVIRWELNQVIEELLGASSQESAAAQARPVLTGLRLKDLKSGATKEVNVDALFVAIGHVPDTELLRGQVELDQEGYVQVDSRQRTSVPGLFAAGDCHDRLYRQAVTAAGMGCIAALEAVRHLSSSNYSAVPVRML